MRSIEHTPSVSPPFQKIEDAVRTTGLSSFFLRKGCRDGSIPCVRSGRTIYVNVLAFCSSMVQRRRSRIWPGRSTWKDGHDGGGEKVLCSVP